MIPEPSTLDGLRCLLDSLHGDENIKNAEVFVFVMHPTDWEEIENEPDCRLPEDIKEVPQRALGSYGGLWIFVLTCWEPGQLCVLPYEGLLEIIDLEDKSWEASN